MTLSVIIVSWNTRDLLRQCLKSLLEELKVNELSEHEIFVIDNNSADRSAEMVAEEFSQVRLIANKDNKGFGTANNQAIQQATGQFILLLNPDTEVLYGSILTLIDFARKNPKAGIVAPQLLNTDNSIQRSCRTFPSLTGMFYELSGLSWLFPKTARFRKYKMLDFDHQSLRQVDQPEGACLLIPKAVLDQVGTFDEKFFMLFEEVELCFRIKKAGWEIWFNPESRIIHHFGQSIKQVKAKMIVSSHKGMYYYWVKHHQRWYQQSFKPLLYIMLASLAVARILLHTLRNTLFKNAQKN